jgi:carbon-monoxide dehydrogenase medium subunit
MRAFDYFSPHTLAEALDLLADLDGQGRLIAGGTDLLLAMKSGTVAPKAVVSIRRLPELQGLDCDSKTGLRMGALTTLRELTRSPLVREHYPCLAHAASCMASVQIRSVATVGGNLCNAAPSADLAPPLIALDAEACLVGPSGERRLPVEALFTGPGETAMKPDELLKEIHVPPPDGEAVYLKHATRAQMDIAVVGVAVRLGRVDDTARSVRIALGAVAPVPLRARSAEAELTGRMLSPERIEHAALVAAAGTSSDLAMRRRRAGSSTSTISIRCRPAGTFSSMSRNTASRCPASAPRWRVFTNKAYGRSLCSCSSRTTHRPPGVRQSKRSPLRPADVGPMRRSR